MTSGLSERLKGGEKIMSLGAGRPMWLGLPLFVFPTQPDMSRAISTWSHSQGPLRLQTSPYLWFIAQKRAPCLFMYCQPHMALPAHFWFVVVVAVCFLDFFKFIYKRRLRQLLRRSDFIFLFQLLNFRVIPFCFFLKHVYVFAFVPVLNVCSTACGNNQITYSH